MPIDIWSLITGLASIVSLAIAIPDRYSSWRRWLVPAGWASAGVAIGRLSYSLGPSADAAFSDPALIGVLGILSVSLIAMYFVIRSVREALNVEGIFIIIFVVGSMWAISSIVTRYLDSIKPPLAISELLEFSKLKEQRGEIGLAVRYLSIARRISEETEERRAIDAKLSELKSIQLAPASSPSSSASASK